MVHAPRPAAARPRTPDLSTLRAALRPARRPGAVPAARSARLLPQLGLLLLALALALSAGAARAGEPGGALLRGAVDVRGAMLTEGDAGRRGADPGELFAAFGAPVGAQLFVGGQVAEEEGDPLFFGATLSARRGRMFGRADTHSGGPFTYDHDRLGADLTVIRRRPAGELVAGLGASWQQIETTGAQGRAVGASPGWGVGFTVEGARTLVGARGKRLSAGLFFEAEMVQLQAGEGALPYSSDQGAISTGIGLRLSGAARLR